VEELWPKVLTEATFSNPVKNARALGSYRVIHDPNRDVEHEVTCVFGKPFPHCNGSGHHVRFVLERGAQHIDHNEHFKQG
jgi:hypothetical protein